MSLPSIHPGLQKRALPLSVKVWHQMIEQGMVSKRAELIRGVIVEKVSKSILHTLLSNWLLDTLKQLAGESFWVRKEDPLTLTDSEPEPDISVVQGRAQDYTEHPNTARLVIEVAVSTLAEDRAMADIYAEAGVSEFWVVNATGKSVEAYREPRDGHYQTMETKRAGELLACAALPGVTLDVAAMFAAVSGPAV